MSVFSLLFRDSLRVRSVNIIHHLNSASQQIVSATSIMLASFEWLDSDVQNVPVAGVMG